MSEKEATKQEMPQDSASPVDRLVSLDDPSAWLESGEYLPEMLRDFHDQKDLFKAMHILFEKNHEDRPGGPNPPSWVDGHCYVIDWFLWYMAGRGYTLQKSRKKLEYWDFEDWRKLNG